MFDVEQWLVTGVGMELQKLGEPLWRVHLQEEMGKAKVKAAKLAGRARPRH